jgi:hypothetical protein
MNIYQRYITKRKKEQEALKAKFKEDEKESQRQAEATVCEETKAMLSKSCAINGMKNCSDECVHFSKGKVIEDVWSGWGWTYKLPYCKLWGSYA